MIKDLLIERDYLPILKMMDGSEIRADSWQNRRREMLELLEKYSYGRTPRTAVSVSAQIRKIGIYHCAGKCKEEIIDLEYRTERGEGGFPIQIFKPTTVENPPVLLHIGFGLAPHRYIPVEEIIDSEYALVVVDYRDMVNDNLHGDFSGGIAEHFGTGKDRSAEEWGKIGMWAWGTSRVMDYLVQDRSDLDTSRVAVIGHSRLGKTALWCAAQDERFAAVISNNSGYGGAASSKHGNGERVVDFLRAGSWDWYCENFKNYRDGLEDEKPYDQSFLLALIAPRYLLVGSAAEDRGADPLSELLTTLHASDAWKLLGRDGLIINADEVSAPAYHGDGDILYHLRHGLHYLSRDDWKAYIRFLDKKFKQ